MEPVFGLLDTSSFFTSPSASFACYFNAGILWFRMGGIRVLYLGTWASWLVLD
jgi:hypothetical protein